MKSFFLPYQNDRPAVTLRLKTKENRWKFFTALAESADGDLFEIYKTTVSAKVEGKEFKLPVGFSKKNVTPIMGRAGFFEQFKVEFDEREGKLKLSNYG